METNKTPMMIRTSPVPDCPECGEPMKLRRPRSDQDWQPFWGCGQFPDCKGVRQITPDGNPETDFLDE